MKTQEYYKQLKKGKIEEVKISFLDLKIRDLKNLVDELQRMNFDHRDEVSERAGLIFERGMIQLDLLEKIEDLENLRSATIAYNLQKHINILEKFNKIAEKIVNKDKKA